jgi:hypothetical protein
MILSLLHPAQLFNQLIRKASSDRRERTVIGIQIHDAVGYIDGETSSGKRRISGIVDQHFIVDVEISVAGNVFRTFKGILIPGGTAGKPFRRQP